MKICQECGHQLNDTARFCNKCGAVLRPSNPQPTQFCPNCRQPQPAGVPAPFCVYCGAPLYQQPPVQAQPMPKPKKSKAPLIAGAAVVAAGVAIAVGVWLHGRGGSTTPQETFVSAQEQLFVTPLLNALETEAGTYGTGAFSTDMTFSASVDSSEINQYLENSSLALKLDMEEDNLLLNGDLVLMGSPVFSGTVTYEDGTLGFYLPELDSNYYVVDLQALFDSAGMPNLDFSAFAPPEISGEELRTLAETYLDVLYTIVTDDNVTVEHRQSITLPQLGASCTGTVYTFQPTARDVQAMILNLADQLENDRQLRSLILEVINGSPMLAMSPYAAYSYDGMYGYGSGAPAYDFESALDESLRSLAAELRSQANYMDTTQDLGLTWTLCMEDNEVRMVRIGSSYGEGAFVFEQSGTPARGCTQVLYMESSYGNNVAFQNEYTKQGGVYDGQITFSTGQPFSITYHMDTDRRSVLGIPYGSYSLSMLYEDVSLSLEVSEGSRGSTDHILSIRGNEYMFGGAFTRLNLTINTTDRSSAQRPSARPVDITNYSQADLEALFSALARRLQSAMPYGTW